jgi:hypothetical protein
VLGGVLTGGSKESPPLSAGVLQDITFPHGIEFDKIKAPEDGKTGVDKFGLDPLAN